MAQRVLAATADSLFPLAFMVTAGGWTRIIYEAGGESAPKRGYGPQSLPHPAPDFPGW